MKNNLTDKVALVTGSGQNLGRHLAVSLAKKGARVAVHYHHSRDEAEKTLSLIKKSSTGDIFQADLSQEKEVALLFRNIRQKLGPVDILVNLIGNFIYLPFSETTFAKFKDVIESNLYSTFLCCREVLPYMKMKKWGRIINFGCVTADSLTVRKNTTPYYIAKTGVIMLTKVLAYEYAKFAITVNSVSPGILKTSVAKPPTPSGGYAQFEDIENAINFILSPASGYLNGANIEVAGGWRPGIE
ncbi:hypothetical protein A3J20_06790 [Candidatus Gottesmanbacteria bacterium RIFCSPLOWO2_02_FULL_42_29]|uniref:SDR family oxidoreductase n=1 Tax=Candidatus Gottesmanbacteria bacterium RIFCSPLOWO2_01_FULL_42_22 TaxID=1798391 RepID=A0A1F6BCB4_9BACT|nr:MAG: short-chain dehydrogenase/reductase SDR [Candidatus Gottesmanbacteria bacterium GW2011_GWC2_42_8]OGG09475.1 MAG: hypothetical protein A2781_06710 [Candidatus Gottesmanbacteria bacterium RIFCSPHIGHO2_01_FULL_42_27]OGG19458.1 MAG: hypothetical protein A3E72_05880 [Candidatus Gottesmanbacteria bacterium RIFCSPHIGHO2_12_FULL_43_26]OGG34591.1 MAG: hypothetical protein A2968_02005 [Candidatus Gottesmanbacteria bacterium RIFCSPLOWO2_01_FULL_42_22]OGG36534.1 MAG: hypothetical protein A3J20_0679